MALSQKHVGKMLVPWFNSNEWKHVKNLIFGDESDNEGKMEGLKLLQMWKLRAPHLPSGVEGTLTILEPFLQQNDAEFNDKFRIYCGACIMRFLNLCAASGDKQGTFYKSAKQSNLPDWLIDLRHDIAHDQIIPSKCMLQKGLEFCFHWLKLEYWEKQSSTLKDFIIQEKTHEEIKVLVDLYCRINLLHYLNSSLNYVKDIGEFDRGLEEDIWNFGQIESTMEISAALGLILNDAVNYVNAVEFGDDVLGTLVSQFLVQNGAIFATSLKEIQGKEVIPQGFITKWKELIVFLYENNILPMFLNSLIQLSLKCDLIEQTSKIATLWVNELLKSLILTQNIYNMYMNLPDCEKLNTDTAEAILRDICLKENPKLKGALLFKLQYGKTVIEKISSNQLDIISNPNENTLNFMRLYMKLLGYTENYINVSELLAQKFLFVEDTQFKNYDVWTVNDFESFVNTTEPKIEIKNSKPEPPSKRWRIVEDTSIFTACPLGLLSHQDSCRNPLLFQ